VAALATEADFDLGNMDLIVLALVVGVGFELTRRNPPAVVLATELDFELGLFVRMVEVRCQLYRRQCYCVFEVRRYSYTMRTHIDCFEGKESCKHPMERRIGYLVERRLSALVGNRRMFHFLSRVFCE